MKFICNTQNYTCKSKVNPHYVYRWENTNQLLWDPSGNYFGVKTGFMPQAGPCLCANFKSDCYDIIAVVLHCKSKEARFTEVPKLIKWAMGKIQKIKNTKLDPELKERLLRNMVHV